jgi:hypothetical protein
VSLEQITEALAASEVAFTAEEGRVYVPAHARSDAASFFESSPNERD